MIIQGKMVGRWWEGNREEEEGGKEPLYLHNCIVENNNKKTVNEETQIGRKTMKKSKMTPALLTTLRVLIKSIMLFK